MCQCAHSSEGGVCHDGSVITWLPDVVASSPECGTVIKDTGTHSPFCQAVRDRLRSKHAGAHYKLMYSAFAF